MAVWRSRPTASTLAVAVAAAMLAAPATAASAATSAHGHGSGKPAAPLTGAARLAQESAAAFTKAKRTGHSVRVNALTTPTSTTVANPRGDLTLTESAAPVRAWRNGRWVNLDARLHTNADRTVSPNVTTAGLRLSGGGTGPLATMTATGHTLSLAWPTALPAPVLSGATATYRSVLKGVDLVVTVSPQGGFGETLVVKSAAAAANPRLAHLTLTAHSDDLSVTADAAGGLRAAAGPHGAPVFTADAPAMWDSAGATPSSAARRTAHPAARSGVTAPGRDAHVSPIKVAVTGHGRSIALAPDRKMLTSASTVYPVYIDPSWTPLNRYSDRLAWAEVDTLDKKAAHWMPDELRSGFCSGDTCAPAYLARSYMRMSVPSELKGAEIESSQLSLWIGSAPYDSCTDAPTSGIDLWATGDISSATTWKQGPRWYRRIAQEDPPACSRQGVVFPITGFMRFQARHHTSLTVGIKAASEHDTNGWKQFDPTRVQLRTTYDHAPGLPTNPATSPGGACQTGDPSATLIGRDDITFQTVATDGDGDSLGTEFVIKDYDGDVVYDTGDAATKGVESASGSVVRLTVPRSQIESWHTDGATAPHQYSWYTRSSDGHLYSPATGLGSAGSPCDFTYDPTRPPAPGVKVATDSSGVAGSLGQTTTLSLAPCAGALASPPTACTGAAPSTYTYQLNSDAPKDVAATGDVQTVRIPLHHEGPNTLTVFSVSAAGNSGESTSADFTVTTPSTPYADGDIDGDGHPDLLFAGTSDHPGLWLAPGDGSGGLGTPIEIGPDGPYGYGGPADWTGAQILRGDFTGRHVQDVVAFYPTGNHAGGGSLLYGNGDDSPLNAVSGSQENLSSNRFVDYTLNFYGDDAIDLVAAGDASLMHTGVADFIGIAGDATNGYQLDLYTTCGGCDIGGLGYNKTLAGPDASPDGAGDWNDFSLVTAQPGGKTVLFALKKSTGEIWESANPGQDTSTLIGTSGTWTKIDAPWSASTVPAFVSGDVDATGHVELWSRSGTEATPYTLNGTALSKGNTVTLDFPAAK